MVWREKSMVVEGDPEVELKFNPWRGITAYVRFNRTVEHRGKKNMDGWTLTFEHVSLMGLKCIAESLDNIIAEHEDYLASIRNQVVAGD